MTPGDTGLPRRAAASSTRQSPRLRHRSVLHSPHAGAAGHVHTIELDQFVGDRYLVTVHGPLGAAADPAAARIEVDALARRLESGRLRPQHAYDLTYALVTAVAKRLREFTARLTADMWNLEYRFQAVVREGPAGHLRDPEQFLDELFRARHGFSMARTQAATSRAVFARMYKIKAFGAGRGQKRIDDAVDQFDYLCALAEGQKETLSASEARKRLFPLIEQVNDDRSPSRSSPRTAPLTWSPQHR